MDGSLPGPSVHGILQARLLEWVAISFSRTKDTICSQILISEILPGNTVGSGEGARDGKNANSGGVAKSGTTAGNQSLILPAELGDSMGHSLCLSPQTAKEVNHHLQSVPG